MKERLARGHRGINPLDEACKEHDIAYCQTNDLEKRHKDDRIPGRKTWERVRSRDTGVLEKTAALTVTGIMKEKTKLGMGSARKKDIEINPKESWEWVHCVKSKELD